MNACIKGPRCSAHGGVGGELDRVSVMRNVQDCGDWDDRCITALSIVGYGRGNPAKETRSGVTADGSCFKPCALYYCSTNCRHTATATHLEE